MSRLSPFPEEERHGRGDTAVDWLVIVLKYAKFIVLALVVLGLLNYFGVLPFSTVTEFLDTYIFGYVEYIMCAVCGALFGLLLADWHFERNYRPTYRGLIQLTDNDVLRMVLVPELLFAQFNQAGNPHIMTAEDGTTFYLVNDIDWDSLKIDYGHAHMDKYLLVMGRRQFFNKWAKRIPGLEKRIYELSISIEAYALEHTGVGLQKMKREIDEHYGIGLGHGMDSDFDWYTGTSKASPVKPREKPAERPEEQTEGEPDDL